MLVSVEEGDHPTRRQRPVCLLKAEDVLLTPVAGAFSDLPPEVAVSLLEHGADRQLVRRTVARSELRGDGVRVHDHPFLALINGDMALLEAAVKA